MTQEENAPSPEESSPAEPTSIEELTKRLEEEKQRAENFYGSWQRTAADFANFKRRTEQERGEAHQFATAMLVAHLLPVVDDLERAMGTLPKELDGLTWIDGIHLIYRKMLAILENQGVKAIDAIGQPFDPALHEAVQHVPGEEGKVIAEYQRGYQMNSRVIRPAMVAVGSGEEAPAQ